jgi:hypothetical protein
MGLILNGVQSNRSRDIGGVWKVNEDSDSFLLKYYHTHRNGRRRAIEGTYPRVNKFFQELSRSCGCAQCARAPRSAEHILDRAEIAQGGSRVRSHHIFAKLPRNAIPYLWLFSG